MHRGRRVLHQRGGGVIMRTSMRIRNIALVAAGPVIVILSLLVPASPRERFLHVLLGLAFYIASAFAITLFDGIASRRPRSESAVALAGVAFGLAAAFSIVHEISGEFVRAMWVTPVLLIIVVMGIWFVYPRGLPRDSAGPHE